MKKMLLLTIFFLAAGCNNFAVTPRPVACTMEAKQCPDGSYVGRSGAACEFAACPQIPAPTPQPTPAPLNLNSGIVGTITIGPTCPVQRNPPDPNCADKPYQATVIVKTSDAAKEVTRFSSKEDGTFKLRLAPGNYLLVPVSGQVLPRGSEQEVVVEKDKFTQVIISYDSGIR